MSGAIGPDPVPALRTTLGDALRPLLDAEGHWALLDFPRYPNPGDSAIWLGTRACFAGLGAPPPLYVAGERTYRADHLRARMPHGTIFLLGGGSFGDLWPDRQAFREQVVRDFPDRRIVQLPQTLQFGSASNLAAARRRLAGHPALTLLVRDRRSLALAQEGLGLEARLAPDAAFALPRAGRGRPPSQDVLWLKRADQESAFDAGPAIDAHDWPPEERTRAWRRMRRLSRRARRSRRCSARRAGGLTQVFDRLAAERLERAHDFLDTGRVVVTDRLHGHILCLLRRQPHVVLDNAYGKVEAFGDVWTRHAPEVRWAASPAEAAGCARGML